MSIVNPTYKQRRCYCFHSLLIHHTASSHGGIGTKIFGKENKSKSFTEFKLFSEYNAFRINNKVNKKKMKMIIELIGNFPGGK